ncbi:MAG: hypothetical protein WBA97_20295 [Actinophytocola sp.]|uniref:hypothetical protein n=1 Tax=Actinophytocola sp. TaxID=1872138 RepID=UPI003C760F73
MFVHDAPVFGDQAVLDAEDFHGGDDSLDVGARRDQGLSLWAEEEVGERLAPDGRRGVVRDESLYLFQKARRASCRCSRLGNCFVELKIEPRVKSN